MFNDNKFHIVPSVRDIKYIDKALNLDEEWILLSCIHIGNLKEITKLCHNKGKKVLINHELVGGLGSDKVAFKFLKQMYEVDGIMGSSNNKLAYIKKEGLLAIRRIALIDSMAVDQTMKSLQESKCDLIELRPGYYAIKYIEKFKNIYPCKYVAGGFIETKEMVDKIYKAGFCGIMTSSMELWGYNPKEK